MQQLRIYKNLAIVANAQLTAYEQIASQYITYTPPSNTQVSVTDYQLQLINGLINNLQTELANL